MTRISTQYSAINPSQGYPDFARQEETLDEALRRLEKLAAILK